MSYASKSGRAKTRPSNPQAFGVCQRCGMWYNRNQLRNQHDWRGTALLPLWIFVCDECYDDPQEQLRAIVLPPDPIPIPLPLIEPFAQDETDYQTITGPPTIDPTTGIPIPVTTTLLDQAGNPLVKEPIGRPNGLTQNATSRLQVVNGVPAHYGVKLPVLSVTSNGSDTITVTCSAPHGLATNDQISVEGLTNSLACGFYSVTVTTATAFTYQTYSQSIPAASLIEPTTIIWTVLVGLPWGFDQIPQEGP